MGEVSSTSLKFHSLIHKILIMKNLSFTNISAVYLSIAMIIAFFTACEQREVLPTPQNIESHIETGKFAKEITVTMENQDEFTLIVSANDNTLLDLVDAQSFHIEPIYETPNIQHPTTSDDSELLTNNLPNHAPENLLIIDVEQPSVKNAIGYKITFNNNETISNRYDKVSQYYRSVHTYKKIYTENTDYTSIKMNYYDDDVHAGYRSLCSGPCSQLSYIFSREDVGVGCQYEYWSHASPNTVINFFN